MFARIPTAALVAGLVAAPLVTGLSAAQAAPAPSAATAIAAAHYDDQGQDRDHDGDQGDAWFIHHCKQRHEWWLSRCQRDRGDMWHRGDPPSTGSW
ncbi:hypothetical protein KHQ06_17085 [Nocardia tengchongensis]|uniref:Uncharacterized protein n=1 Tax=Nocardia tengchongensis TaxID=2055889 RepID=A0ABX8CWP4_9NOCA|nr:hypothetical protein [Nocardia tengchongensis]QVI24322.1 hypothetical protein KHQ06_17085 [Nocardia tengchongensis]